MSKSTKFNPLTTPYKIQHIIGKALDTKFRKPQSFEHINTRTKNIFMQYIFRHILLMHPLPHFVQTSTKQPIILYKLLNFIWKTLDLTVQGPVAFGKIPNLFEHEPFSLVQHIVCKTTPLMKLRISSCSHDRSWFLPDNTGHVEFIACLNGDGGINDEHATRICQFVDNRERVTEIVGNPIAKTCVVISKRVTVSEFSGLVKQTLDKTAKDGVETECAFVLIERRSDIEELPADFFIHVANTPNTIMPAGINTEEQKIVDMNRKWRTESLGIRVGKSPIAGYGVFANRDFKTKEDVLTYDGERLTKQEVLKMDNVDYVFGVTKDEFIDGRNNLGGKVNSPSKGMKPNLKFVVSQRKKIVKLRTIRPINEGDELLVSYGAKYWKFKK